MNTFISLIGTGIPGFLSYWYLSKQGLIDFNKDRKDEKLIALATLSAINIFFTWILSLFVYQIFGEIISIDSMSAWQMITVFLIGLTVSFLFTKFIYPKVLSWAITEVDTQLKNQGKPFLINRHILKDLIYKSKKKYIAVYIFENDENKRLVESGFLESLGEIEGNLQLMLSSETFGTGEDIAYNEISEAFNNENIPKEDKHIYIDIKQKVIMFIFFMDK